MYEVAGYIPIEARRLAVGLAYDDPVPSGLRRYGGWCPLAMCLRSMNLMVGNGVLEITDALYPLVDTAVIDVQLLGREVGRFAQDWDEGIITDLADALGVTD